MRRFLALSLPTSPIAAVRRDCPSRSRVSPYAENDEPEAGELYAG
jgi:hypothetical protein